MVYKNVDVSSSAKKRRKAAKKRRAISAIKWIALLVGFVAAVITIAQAVERASKHQCIEIRIQTVLERPLERIAADLSASRMDFRNEARGSPVLL